MLLDIFRFLGIKKSISNLGAQTCMQIENFEESKTQ